MAPVATALTKEPVGEVSEHINPAQTLRAATSLLRKIQSDQTTHQATNEKPSLLADADEEKDDDNVPIWLILTTKKHVIDRPRLKPGKILLPHPYLNTSDPSLRICLITADPQRTYKDLITHPAFPLDVSQRIGRVIGLTKLKAKYKTFETRRQLLSEYDVFLADDRIITSLPQALGSVFYKSGSKRPIPINLLGKRQSFDEQGNKRRKLSEGGTKVTRSDVKPTDVAHEISRALSCALVHLAPSTTTAVKVGSSKLEPQQLQENVEAVVAQMVDKYVPQKWRNMRSVHIKGPETAALPIWLAEELWEDENDVLEQAPPAKDGKRGKKRRLGDAAAEGDAGVIEVPGPDGKMRRLEKPKKQQDESHEEAEAKELEKKEKAARKEALQKQKIAAKEAANGVKESAKAEVVRNGGVKTSKKSRAKAAELN